MEEAQLIEKCKHEDRKAQQRIYEQHARTMYGICLRYTSDAEAAQDLLHDGFIKVFAHIASFEGKGSFEGWLKRIFINLALENIRKEKIKKQFVDDIDQISDTDIVNDEDEDAENLSEEALLEMIQQLPHGYKTVFNLYAIEDYSHKEISHMLGIAEGTSRSQYIRARQLLQDKIKNYFKLNELR